MKTILIIAENRDVRTLLEGKLKAEISCSHIASSTVETHIIAKDAKIVIVEEGKHYTSFVYDEIKHVTKESLLMELLNQKADSVVNEISKIGKTKLFTQTNNENIGRNITVHTDEIISPSCDLNALVKKSKILDEIMERIKPLDEK